MSPAGKPLVVVTQRFFDREAVNCLHRNGCDVRVVDLAPGQSDAEMQHSMLVEQLSDADGWIVGHADVNRMLLRELPRLKVISRRGVGYERIDTGAVRDSGKVATIAVGGNDASVADHAIALMLAVGRRLRESQLRMEQGAWSILVGSDLYRKTVGIVGLGRIGRAVVQRLEGFEAHVLVTSRRKDEDCARHPRIEFVPLNALLAQSDYVSLHAPFGAQTHHMIDAPALRKMKSDAVLINTARGGLVDDRALLAALKGRALAGAGLDVFESESDPSLRPVTDELVGLPNVVASPHAAASTNEGLRRTNLIAARNVIAVLAGLDLPSECVVADGRQRLPHHAS